MNRACRSFSAMAIASLFATQALGQSGISAEVSTPRQSVFVNETFDLTISIDCGGLRLAQDVELNSLPDSSKLALGDFHELQPERRIVDNQIREFRSSRCRARALSAGTLEISPVLKVKILRREKSFFGYAWVETAMEVRAKPVVLTVNPVPEKDRPAGFSGVIGQFALEAGASPTDVAVGDLITLSMKIKGDGYLEEAPSPRLAPTHNFRAYDPKPVPEKSGPSEKAFEQVLIPQSANATAVPAVSFVYFDPISASYRTAMKGPFPLTFHHRRAVAFEQYRPKQANEAATAPLQGAISNAQTGAASDEIARPSPGVAERLRRAIGSLRGEPPAAIALSNQAAMFAPSESSIKTFEVPAGAETRVLGSRGNWLKIAFGEKRGWVPASSMSSLDAESSP